ncbi:DUF7264 domain-containing protein [Tomitella cavernea]|uniref:LtfC/p132/Gp6 beta-sandwich domain-containing protein n=1 Tax=Tomitella cavernea TaxID=1387982 RepID=A0ABP9CIU1_9ACTN|nr:hypothetical protein [Tomitella cavernea]
MATLDAEGIKSKLILQSGQDFQLTVHPPGTQEFPSGTTAEIVIREGRNPTSTVLDTWTGVVSSTSITWWVQTAKTDLIPERAQYLLLVHIPQGSETLDRCFFYGTIDRKDA